VPKDFVAETDADRLQWPDHDSQWSHSFEHDVQKDFVAVVHIVFMNHLGMKYVILLLLLVFS